MAVTQQLPTDPDVKMPAAVRRATEQIDAMYQPPQDAPTKEQIPPPPPTNNGQAPAPAPAPAGQLMDENGQPMFGPDGQPLLDDETWEHKYNSMKGRYERTLNHVRSLSDQVMQMQGEVAKIKSAPSAPVPPELRAERLLTPQEIELYGTDLLDVVGKKAKEDLSPEITSLKQQIEELRRSTQIRDENTARDARQSLYHTLDERLPNWREINGRKEFVDWLALPDKYSGDIRHALLNRAFEQNDSPRVIAFFQGFLSEEAALAPAAVHEMAPVGIRPTVPLDTFAAPGRAKTSAATAPVEKPVFTRAQISQFYTDVAAGRWRGRDEERVRMDVAIHEAGREGRVR
jgi:hypothetical protein